MNKVLAWITNLGNIAKLLPLVFAIAGCIAWYNNHIIKKYNEKNNDKALTESVQTVIIQNDSLFKMFDQMKDEQLSLKNDVISKLDEVSGTVGIMKSQLGQHIVKTATKEDIMEWMRAFEKKNNRWNEGSTSLILCK
jgi:L-lactate utilization protein LutB